MEQLQMNKFNHILKAYLTNTLSTEMNNCKFKLDPETFSTKVYVKEYDTSITTNYQCKMKQIPANINDATTGHKLQGMPKDIIIVASWPTKSMFKNWEYVVLSHVRTLSGLYLSNLLTLINHLNHQMN
jgi:hypothetical protein